VLVLQSKNELVQIVQEQRTKKTLVELEQPKTMMVLVLPMTKLVVLPMRRKVVVQPMRRMVVVLSMRRKVVALHLTSSDEQHLSTTKTLSVLLTMNCFYIRCEIVDRERPKLHHQAAQMQAVEELVETVERIAGHSTHWLSHWRNDRRNQA